MFRNLKEVNTYYKYPMSHRFGSIYDKKGKIRIYSNGKKNDKKTKLFFYYELKNNFIKEKFKLNILNNKDVRIIVKTLDGVIDYGLYKVKGFTGNRVRLKKN